MSMTTRSFSMAMAFAVIGASGLHAQAASTTAGLDTNGIPGLDPFSEVSYARFSNGSECYWGFHWLESLHWRDQRPDTVFQTAAGNPLQSATASMVNTCQQKYTVNGSEKRELLGVAQAALVAKDKAKAEAALARFIKTQPTEPAFDRLWAYVQAIDVMLSAPQPELKPAEGYIAKLDAMGPPAAVERMMVHTQLAKEAARRDSVSLWSHELQAALAASKEITGDDRKQYAPEAAAVYIALAKLKERQDDIAGARAILVTGRSELIPLRPSVSRDFATAESWTAMQGQAPGPLKVSGWVAARGDTNTPRPIKGRPAVFAFVSANCGNFCYNDYGVLRRLMSHYSAGAVDFILVTHTEGYSHDRLISPDSEMAIIGDYFTQFMKFPASVALWKSTYHRRFDERLMLETPPIEQAYNPPHDQLHITVGVLDKDGKIRFYTTLARENEIMLDDIIKSLI